jgi:hypothetical protein
MTAEEKRHIQKIDGTWIYLFPEGGATIGQSKREVEQNVDWLRSRPKEWAEYQALARQHPNRLVVH